MSAKALPKQKDPKAKERKVLGMQRAFWVALDASERKSAEKSWRREWDADWVNERDNEGKTMLHWALLAINARKNDPSGGFEEKVTTLMLSKGANPNERDAKGSTPLHWAGMMGNIACAKALLAAGANPLIRDQSGKTPLACAKRPAPKGMGFTGATLDKNKQELARIIGAAAEAWRLDKALSAGKKKEISPKPKKLRV